MRYREVKPAAALREMVECFWTLEAEARRGAAADPVLPDGCVEVVLNFGDPFLEHRDDGSHETQPLRLIAGQMTRPLRIAPTGKVSLIGIRFNPRGARPFLKVAVSELTDRYAALEDVAVCPEPDMIERVCDAPSMEGRITLLEESLTRWSRDLPGDDSWVGKSVDRILESNGLISIDELSAGAGVSSRQLERQFNREVGVGPKVLCRILRFQRVFRAVDRDSSNWAAVAVDCGYYDQSHLIRDFQRFAGTTPASILASAGELTELFTRKNRESNFSNTRP